MAKPKVYTSERWLKRKFYDESKTVEEIAKECNVSTNTIRTQLKKYNIIK